MAICTGIQSMYFGVPWPRYDLAPPSAMCLKLGKITYPSLVHLQDGDKVPTQKMGLRIKAG